MAHFLNKVARATGSKDVAKASSSAYTVQSEGRQAKHTASRANNNLKRAKDKKKKNKKKGEESDSSSSD